MIELISCKLVINLVAFEILFVFDKAKEAVTSPLFEYEIYHYTETLF